METKMSNGNITWWNFINVLIAGNDFVAQINKDVLSHEHTPCEFFFKFCHWNMHMLTGKADDAPGDPGGDHSDRQE